MNRREMLGCMCLGGAATWVAPTASFGRLPGRARLVFVLLRGGVDGLAAVVPDGDPGYRSIRRPMAFASNDLTALSGGFSLAPGLSALHELWAADQLAALHALAIPYRTRSHFEGQAILETGLDRPVGSSDGWLNRLLQVTDGTNAGVAVAAGLPRSMAGPHPVLTWSPTQLGVLGDAYLERLHLLYRNDPLLLDRFEAALQIGASVEEVMGQPPTRRGDRPGGGARESAIFRATANLLREDDGPNLAAVELGGWDTHANQGMAGGALDRRLAGLAAGLLAFREASGSRWQDTTVVVMTEFGRTARPNGTTGTDHGTAGVGFVLGPKIARSAVVTDWPGLGARDLHDGRDLRPTLDTRAVLKAVVTGALDLTREQAERVFPGSGSIAPLAGLMR